LCVFLGNVITACVQDRLHQTDQVASSGEAQLIRGSLCDRSRLGLGDSDNCMPSGQLSPSYVPYLMIPLNGLFAPTVADLSNARTG